MQPESLNSGRHLDPTKGRQIAPHTHWIVLAVLVVVLAVSLLVQGYTHHLFNTASDGVGQPQGPSGKVPAAVSGGGPVISAAAQPRTAAVKRGTIALTFDDGPDPVWTPKILEVLRRNHVHATFFVVGTQVAAHPEILRQILADGHEVGVHTFTHADLGRVPAWRQSLELSETQLVVAGATGQTTSLLRPPIRLVQRRPRQRGVGRPAQRGRRWLSHGTHHPRQSGLASPGGRSSHRQLHAQGRRRSGSAHA